jgi:hypothetical protein
MQKVITNPAARDKNKTCTNSLVRYLMLSCASLSSMVMRPSPHSCPCAPHNRSLDWLRVQQPGGFKRAERGARVVGLTDSRVASL